MAHIVRIEMLGEFRVHIGNRIITRFSTQKGAALLAYVAYHLVPHPRDVLVEILWPDGLPEAGRASLSQALSMLRRQLEPPGVAAGGVIVSNKSHVGLNPEAIETDVLQFHSDLRKSRFGAGRSVRIQALQDATDLYRGELLPGFYEDWVQIEKIRLKDEYIRAVEDLTALLEEDGEFQRAIDYARRALNLDPLREGSHQLVMRLHAAVGEHAAALEQYRALERLLLEELDSAPSPTTRELAADIERIAQVPRGAKLGAAKPRRKGSRASLPRGTVTFLLTEIETANPPRLTTGVETSQALNSHNRLLRGLFRKNNGHEIREAGGSFLVAFEAATDALACAITIQQRLAGVKETASEAFRSQVRMALHTGEVKVEAGAYQGPTLQRSTRILTAAHAGQIICSEPTAALSRGDLPTGVRLVDLGVFRLRDVQAPEHLFQINYDGMARTDFPAPRAEAGYQSNLPLQFTRFFGREEQLAQLGEMLQSAETRLVTITGSGGTGKTRLALEAGNRMLEPFGGAVWFVPLVDLSDPTLIAGAIIDSLRVPRLPTTDPLDQAVELLKRQSSLLILDNLEQFVEGAGKVVRTLLERVPLLTCLVTSRQSLALTGEREYPLAPLAIPNGHGTPERLSMFESVRLFVDRAQAVRPDFQVTNQNAPAVAELCDRLEGIPLAIELAAARASVFSPSQMLLQLERRFDFLVSRRRDAAPRHETLRAAIDWSYDLLSPEVQQFFLRLSVFRGGWTVAAAEAVCLANTPEETGPGPGLALDYLAQLRDCSLILAEESSEGIRFGMLVTLREYAEERLSPNDRCDAQQRHLDFFLHIAEYAKPLLTGPEQAIWLDLLDSEHDNLRAALSFALDVTPGKFPTANTQRSTPNAETALRFTVLLMRFWILRGSLAEGLAWTEASITYSVEGQRTAERANALNCAGALACAQGDYARARNFIEASLAMHREIGNQKGAASALTNMETLACKQGDYASAFAYGEEALDLNRKFGNMADVAGVLCNLGLFAIHRGEYASAAAHLKESLSIDRDIGNRAGIASDLCNLGVVAVMQGDYIAALTYQEESLSICRDIGIKAGIATSLNQIGNIASEQGDNTAARGYYEESLAVARGMGDREQIVRSLSNLGGAVDDAGDCAAARALYEECLEIARELGDRYCVAGVLINLGSILTSPFSRLHSKNLAPLGPYVVTLL